MKRVMSLLVLSSLAGLAGCEADEPVPLDRPEAMEGAPIIDDVPATRLENPGIVPEDTLHEIEIETDTAL